jgi:hypothetical protein
MISPIRLEDLQALQQLRIENNVQGFALNENRLQSSERLDVGGTAVFVAGVDDPDGPARWVP